MGAARSRFGPKPSGAISNIEADIENATAANSRIRDVALRPKRRTSLGLRSLSVGYGDFGSGERDSPQAAVLLG